jgi:hypothetical protein
MQLNVQYFRLILSFQTRFLQTNKLDAALLGSDSSENDDGASIFFECRGLTIAKYLHINLINSKNLTHMKLEFSDRSGNGAGGGGYDTNS